LEKNFFFTYKNFGKSGKKNLAPAGLEPDHLGFEPSAFDHYSTAPYNIWLAKTIMNQLLKKFKRDKNIIFTVKKIIFLPLCLEFVPLSFDTKFEKNYFRKKVEKINFLTPKNKNKIFFHF